MWVKRGIRGVYIIASRAYIIVHIGMRQKFDIRSAHTSQSTPIIYINFLDNISRVHTQSHRRHRQRHTTRPPNLALARQRSPRESRRCRERCMRGIHWQVFQPVHFHSWPLLSLSLTAREKRSMHVYELYTCTHITQPALCYARAAARAGAESLTGSGRHHWRFATASCTYYTARARATELAKISRGRGAPEKERERERGINKSASVGK